jgi:hypothetical protein
VFASVQGKTSVKSVSLDPEDTNSEFYDNGDPKNLGLKINETN